MMAYRHSHVPASGDVHTNVRAGNTGFVYSDVLLNELESHPYIMIVRNCPLNSLLKIKRRVFLCVSPLGKSFLCVPYKIVRWFTTAVGVSLRLTPTGYHITIPVTYS
jgi:hypothetical protein